MADESDDPFDIFDESDSDDNNGAVDDDDSECGGSEGGFGTITPDHGATAAGTKPAAPEVPSVANGVATSEMIAKAQQDSGDGSGGAAAVPVPDVVAPATTPAADTHDAHAHESDRSGSGDDDGRGSGDDDGHASGDDDGSGSDDDYGSGSGDDDGSGSGDDDGSGSGDDDDVSGSQTSERASSGDEGSVDAEEEEEPTTLEEALILLRVARADNRSLIAARQGVNKVLKQTAAVR